MAHFNRYPDLQNLTGCYISDEYDGQCMEQFSWQGSFEPEYMDFDNGELPLTLGNEQQLSNMGRYLVGQDSRPFRTDALLATLDARNVCGSLAVQPLLETCNPAIYLRQSSPAEQSTGGSSQWSSSHYDDASTPHNAPYSMPSASNYCQKPRYQEFGSMPMHPGQISGGGIALSAIQHYPDENDTGGTGYEDIDAEHDVHYEQDTVSFSAKAERNGGLNEETMDLEQKSAHVAREGSVYDAKEEDDDSSSDYKGRGPTTSKTTRRRSSQTSVNYTNGVRKGHGRRRSSTSVFDSKCGNAKGAQRKHVNSKYRAARTVTSSVVIRPFPCPFAGYNCNATFTAKNEWKRHVSTQHIKLGFWRCDLCSPTDTSDPANPGDFNDFNRKDLFTQHLRRMHAGALASPGGSLASPSTPTPKKGGTGKVPTNIISDEVISSVQHRCYVRIRSPPPRSNCLFCNRNFQGTGSWTDRMDHVGNHFERDRRSSTDNSTDDNKMLDANAWKDDKILQEWLVEEGLVAWDEQGEWRIGDGIPIRESS